MKNIKIGAIAILAMTMINCKENKKNAADTSTDGLDKSVDQMETNVREMKDDVMGETLTVMMTSKSNSNMSGEITFSQDEEEVEMKAVFKGLEEGSHAIHLHENADCTSGDGKSAGGHWNPTDEPHGKWGAEEGYHKGDIGNFTADADGNATVEFSTDEWCIGCDDDTKNIIGRSVIVHKGQDDFTSQPSGDAGSRIGCAGITK
ncbi:superoxide dismutase family protein [Zobellia amurskyensis]|uniref:Superoxide dismutase [Cu-Zn] n=1 Tax=Zobellia amurskyensis TaxID=248905 RepID=A0A7X3D1F8_9FLAO|nr:superoxide dismutase family protein [Zobellia amurskyensis]MUH36124.1 superoxide dismutase family protein [Zobellia amurskyensis]